MVYTIIVPCIFETHLTRLSVSLLISTKFNVIIVAIKCVIFFIILFTALMLSCRLIIVLRGNIEGVHIIRYTEYLLIYIYEYIWVNIIMVILIPLTISQISRKANTWRLANTKVWNSLPHYAYIKMDKKKIDDFSRF